MKLNKPKIKLIKDYIEKNEMPVKEFADLCNIDEDICEKILSGTPTGLLSLYKVARIVGFYV